MTEFAVRMITESPEWTGDRDASKIRLRVERRGGEYVQFVTPVMSGPDLKSKEAKAVPRPELWAAVAREALPLIAEAIRHGHIPLHDPKMAFEVFPSLQQVIRTAREDPKVFAEEDVVGEI